MPIECPMRADILRHWSRSPCKLESLTAGLVMQAEMFNIQNIIDYIDRVVEKQKFEQQVYETLNLPFPVCHFEFKLPMRWITKEKDEVGATDVSVTVCNTERLNSYSFVTSLRGEVDQKPGLLTVVELPRSNMAADGSVKLAIESGTMGDRMEKLLRRKYPKGNVAVNTIEEICARCVAPVLFALNLLECRNVAQHVEQRDTETFHKENGGKKKEWVPQFQYKVINIPFFKKVKSGEYDKELAEHKNLPLQKVRGHFKTYTAEKPLMGRAVGKFWWPPTLKGKGENGIIVKDYKFDEIELPTEDTK